MNRTVALMAALLVVMLGYGADSATAAYKAQIGSGTLKLVGDGASDKLVLRLAPGSPNTLEVDVGANGTADFSFDRTAFTAITVEAGGGSDEVRVDQINGSFADELLTMNGGDGADTLLGGSGAEILLGGKGNDLVLGGDGNDTALLGDGDDVFRWNPGDDSDVVEGQVGRDLLDFFGAAANETINMSANGARVRFTRDVAAITMDLDDVERVDFHARGGVDAITVDDLSGTDLRTVAADLTAFDGAGDGAPDTVVARGTSGADLVDVTSAGGAVLVSGLWAQVQVTGGEPALDAVVVDGGDGLDTTRYNGTAGADSIGLFANGTAVSTLGPATTRVDTTAVESLIVLGLGGADAITATGNIAQLTALTIDGGDGNDTLRGGNGADLIVAGKGDDFVDGNQGPDRALLGDGNDRFQWDPGDTSDVVDGQAGTDLLDFFGASIGESIALAANGGHALLTRDIASIVMDLDNLEGVSVHVLGGIDTVAVSDLAGTDVKTVDVDFAAFGGGGDLQPDTVVVNGTSKRDVVQVSRSGAQVLVSGLAARTRITGSEASDTLLVRTLAGDDDVTVAAGVSDLITPVVDLGTDEGLFALAAAPAPQTSPGDSLDPRTYEPESRLFLVTHATGVQKYTCQANGTWLFTDPEATLYKTTGTPQPIGAHFLNFASGRPVWQLDDGSSVEAARWAAMSAGTQNIPWLLLRKVVTTSGADGDRLTRTTWVQRLNTSGGVAPGGTCTPGDTIAVAYSADYLFWRAGSDD
jgi:Ca2+-binding RTX toxin-like protein